MTGSDWLASAEDDEPRGFGVWCEVSGGITGYREAWLKANGAVAVFDTAEEAEHVAAETQAKANASPHRTANFRYTVREF